MKRVLIAIFILILSGCAQKSENKNLKSELVDFVGCLSEKQTVVYFTAECEFCKRQREIFGDKFELLKSVNCSLENEKCDGLKNFPLWKIGGKEYVGYKNFMELEKISNCKLNK